MASDPSQVKLSAALLGGVSALPSLHVGMVSLTTYWLAVSNPKTLFVGIPWLVGVWTSTALLGWHYVLDGAGGILLAVVCIYLTRFMLSKLGCGLPAAEPLAPHGWGFSNRLETPQSASAA
jgi:membrane-associated phospholipid phosphatase